MAKQIKTPKQKAAIPASSVDATGATAIPVTGIVRIVGDGEQGNFQKT